MCTFSTLNWLLTQKCRIQQAFVNTELIRVWMTSLVHESHDLSDAEWGLYNAWFSLLQNKTLVARLVSVSECCLRVWLKVSAGPQTKQEKSRTQRPGHLRASPRPTWDATQLNSLHSRLKRSGLTGPGEVTNQTTAAHSVFRVKLMWLWESCRTVVCYSASGGHVL